MIGHDVYVFLKPNFRIIMDFNLFPCKCIMQYTLQHFGKLRSLTSIDRSRKCLENTEKLVIILSDFPSTSSWINCSESELLRQTFFHKDHQVQWKELFIRIALRCFSLVISALNVSIFNSFTVIQSLTSSLPDLMYSRRFSLLL